MNKDQELHIEAQSNDDEFPKERIVVINNVRYKCIRQDEDKGNEEVPCPEKLKALQQGEQIVQENNEKTTDSNLHESQEQNQADKTSSQLTSRAESPELSVTIEYEILIQSESSNTNTEEKRSESQLTSRADTPQNAEQQDRNDDQNYPKNISYTTTQEASIKSQSSRPASPELKDYSDKTQYDTRSLISQESSSSNLRTQTPLVADTRYEHELQKSSSSSSRHSETHFSNERRKSRSDSEKFESSRSDDQFLKHNVQQIISELSFPVDPNKPRSKFDSDRQELSSNSPSMKDNHSLSNIPSLQNVQSPFNQSTTPQQQSRLQSQHDHLAASESDNQRHSGFSPSFSRTESEKNKTPEINDLIPEIEKILSQMDRQKQDQNLNHQNSTFSQGTRDSSFSESYSSHSKSLDNKQSTNGQKYSPEEHYRFRDEAEFALIGQNRPNNQYVLTEKDFLPSPRPASENKLTSKDIEKALNNIQINNNQEGNQLSLHNYDQQEQELNLINQYNQPKEKISTYQDLQHSPKPTLEPKFSIAGNNERELENIQTYNQGNNQYDISRYYDESKLNPINQNVQSPKKILTDRDFLPSTRSESQNKITIPDIESLIPDIEKALIKLNMQMNNNQESYEYEQHREEPELHFINQNNQAQRRDFTDQDFLPSPNRPSSENKNAIPDIESLIPGIEKALDKLNQSQYKTHSKIDEFSFKQNNDSIISHQQNQTFDQVNQSQDSRISSQLKSISNIDQDFIPKIIQSLAGNPISGVFAVPGRYSGYDSSAHDQNQQNQKFTPLSVYDKLMIDPRFYTQNVDCNDKSFPKTHHLPSISSPIPISVEPKPFIQHETRMCHYVLTKVSKHVIRTVRKEIICK